MRKALLITLAMLGITIYYATYYQVWLPELTTVSNIDLARYTGKWYEITAIPMRQEEGCYNTQAVYTAETGYIQVHNTCNIGAFDGPLNEAYAKAYPNAENNAKLMVYFTKIEIFGGGYWVIGLDPDYQWAIVGNPSREFGWILSRTPTISQELLDELFGILTDKFYDVRKFVMTPQQTQQLN
jgi:apolipoprotein D and lipocalin family protein